MALTLLVALLAIISVLDNFNNILPYSKKSTIILMLLFPVIYYFIRSSFTLETQRGFSPEINAFYFSSVIYVIAVNCISRMKTGFKLKNIKDEQIDTTKRHIIVLEKFAIILIICIYVFIHIISILVLFTVVKISVELAIQISQFYLIIYTMVLYFTKSKCAGESEKKVIKFNLLISKIFKVISIIILIYIFFYVIFMDWILAHLIDHPAAGKLIIIVLPIFIITISWILVKNVERLKNKDFKFLAKLIIVTILLFPVMCMNTFTTIGKIDGSINKCKMIAYVENGYGIKIEVVDEEIGNYYREPGVVGVLTDERSPDYLTLRTIDDRKITFNISYKKGKIEENYLETLNEKS